jgi:hypothetical protein
MLMLSMRMMTTTEAFLNSAFTELTCGDCRVVLFFKGTVAQDFLALVKKKN